jgi:predicted GIY-YIG superfamily endonuclease
MHYVYLLRSISHPDQTYIGQTADLKARLRKHNEGGSPHTAKYKPWQLHSYHAFSDKHRAAEFETYLKSGSGRAFAQKHFW